MLKPYNLFVVALRTFEVPDQEQANKQTKQTKRGEKKKQQPRELVAILFVCIRNEQSVTVIEWVFSARASFHLSRCVDKKTLATCAAKGLLSFYQQSAADAPLKITLAIFFE